MKALIFDSGTLINFSMNGLLDILRELKKSFNGKFLITREVEKEIIINPMKMQKYKLGALRLKEIIEDKTLELPESVGVSSGEVSLKMKKYFAYANNLFYRGRASIKLIDSGEASTLALSSLLNEKGIRNVIAIDERTTRMLFESPEDLKELMEKKLHISINTGKFSSLDNFKFIRSVELVYIAFKKKLIKNKEMLDAVLYGTKFKGAAVSDKEIKEIEKL